MITVKELREALKHLPDDLPVVTHGNDHSYNHIWWAGKIQAQGNPRELYEYSEGCYVHPDNEILDAFLVSDA